jgi:hypothetical protein
VQRLRKGYTFILIAIKETRKDIDRSSDTNNARGLGLDLLRVFNLY